MARIQMFLKELLKKTSNVALRTPLVNSSILILNYSKELKSM
jgi:hypothetical protein